MTDSCVICLCVYNSEQYLPKVLEVVDKTAELFEDYKIVFAYDDSGDKSGDILLNYTKREPNAEIITGDRDPLKPRVFNIATARNNCLNYIKNLDFQPIYFIMIDANYSVQTKFRPYILRKHLEESENWDALSFNRKKYYDEWALSFGNYKISIWHLDDKIRDSYRENMRKALADGFKKIGKNNYLPVDSAFCGFGIYKTHIFINYKYSVNWRPDLLLNPADFRAYMKPGIIREQAQWIGDCEHRNFHAEAKNGSNARIMIANAQLFSPDD